ncbi:MAG TPA: alpha/beta hydrolase [Eudoraea sp.]|nr:alpha/beta hydrolase [Eudoraea sp.]
MAHSKLAIIHFVIVLLTGLIIHGQERYKDPVFSGIAVETYTYSDTLRLDFYTGKADSVKGKPLLVLVHGGGFAVGKRDNRLEADFSRDMAKRGYAVASISYRLLRKGKSFGCDCPAAEKINIFLAVSEDIRRAVRYLSDRAETLKFDPEKIVLIGSSAGAEAVLNTAFMQYHHRFKALPYPNLSYAAVVSFAGAVMDASYITGDNVVPTLLFHGEMDNLVPFGTAAHHNCAANTTGYIVLEGAATIAERIAALGGSYQLVYDPTGNHDWANFPYADAGSISEFIKRTVIDGEHLQSRVKIDKRSDK